MKDRRREAFLLTSIIIRQFIQDSEKPGPVLEPFILFGLLANYNKFESQNPYQLRFNDFVNESTIQKIVQCVGYTCQALRLDYIDVQDDLPEGWTWSNTLNLIGLGLIVRGPTRNHSMMWRQRSSYFPSCESHNLCPPRPRPRAQLAD